MTTPSPPSLGKKIIGGSFENAVFLKALRKFNINKIQAKKKYKFVATTLGITPMRRKPNGDLTNIPLKEGTKGWKDFIEKETIRRYKTELGVEAELKAIANKKILDEELKVSSQNIKKGLKKSDRPRVDERRLISNIHNYKKYYYRTANVKTIEELYEIIKKEADKFGGNIYISLLLTSDEDKKLNRFITIGGDNLYSFEDFLARYEKIKEGKLEGSDAFNDSEVNLVLNEFHIGVLPAQQVGGKSDSIIYECEGIDSKEKFCGYECLKKLGYDYDGDKKLLRTREGLLKYLDDNQLPIAVVLNSFALKKKLNKIQEENGIERRRMVIGKRKDELRILTRLYSKDYEPIYIYEPKGFKHTIIYDTINAHFDVMRNYKPTLKDEIRLSASMEIIYEDKILFKASQINYNAEVKYNTKHKYIFFDYETVIDFKHSSIMIPYSLSVLILDEDEIENLVEYDKANDKVNVDKIRKSNCKTFLGYDCNEEFLKWFSDASHETIFCFVGFNNSNFDNFLLLDGILQFKEQMGLKYDIDASRIFYNGSQLLNFYIDGRHSFFDIRKHLVGSLDANCKSFKINCCAKKSFDHSKAQFLHQDNQLTNFITGNEELKEYNEFDVLATAVLFQKYKQALLNIPSTHEYAKNLKQHTTIGSLVYKVFNDHTEKFKLKDKKDKPKQMFGKLSYKQYKDLQKHKIAGRVELFNGIQKIEERMGSTDVCSLYPYVMSVLNCYYPCGDIIEVQEYRGDDEIGFYYCDIDQSNLKAKNLPKIYAKKSETENDWDCDEVLENYLISNVMIGLLIKNGCKVVIKNGFIFERKLKSCEMFAFLLDMMKAKNEQDTFKSNDDSNYNSALRETLKLLMNSLSGKVIEGLHTEQTRDFDSVEEYEKVVMKAKCVNFINNIGNKLFITYEMDEEKLCETKQRPIFLGVLIYDYAKRYMFENSYSKIGLKDLVYTDTDASKFRYSAMDDWTKWINENNIQVPHWKEVEEIDPRYKNHLIYQPNSKVFGSFEDELDELQGHHYRFYCVEKKSWSYVVMNEDDTYKHSKFKFKGINGKAIMLDLDEPFVEIKKTKKQDGTITYRHILKEDCELEVYTYCERNKHLAIESGNIGKFFDKLFEDREAYVITNSFRKIVKNSARSVEMGDEERYNDLLNCIQVNYSMKKITLKN
jgi:hypothetical protein